MVRVIGEKGCSRCEITKQILKNKGITFEYILLSEQSEEEQNKILNLAQEKGMMQMPLILKDDCLVEIKEI